jgi:hypothetical protein
MPPSSTNPNRVLLFGRDETLLDSRALVLRSAHIEVDITTDKETFRIRIIGHNCPYRVVVCCYTVADAEREEMATIVARSRITMMQLDSMVMPSALIERVSALLALPMSNEDSL